MRSIYHILPRTAWNSVEPVRAESLKTEGFIHCSNRHQVEWVANQFFTGATDLVVLVIDAAKLTSPLRDEDPGIGQTFPHVYGPIDCKAIVGTETLQRDDAGRWVMPGPAGSELRHQ